MIKSVASLKKSEIITESCFPDRFYQIKQAWNFFISFLALTYSFSDTSIIAVSLSVTALSVSKHEEICFTNNLWWNANVDNFWRLKGHCGLLLDPFKQFRRVIFASNASGVDLISSLKVLALTDVVKCRKCVCYRKEIFVFV